MVILPNRTRYDHRVKSNEALDVNKKPKRGEWFFSSRIKYKTALKITHFIFTHTRSWHPSIYICHTCFLIPFLPFLPVLYHTTSYCWKRKKKYLNPKQPLAGRGPRLFVMQKNLFFQAEIFKKTNQNDKLLHCSHIQKGQINKISFVN